MPGGGALGTAARSGSPPPIALSPNTTDNSWFYQLVADVTPVTTNAVYADLDAFSATKTPSQDGGFVRESYFSYLQYDGSPAQIGYDEWPGQSLHIFIYVQNTTRGVTCLGNMVPEFQNPNGTYQGCEGLASSFGGGFDEYRYAQEWDNAGQLQFYFNGIELGYYADGTSPGIGTQLFESEIADAGGSQTMQQLLNDGLKNYSYYVDFYSWNGSAWVQFTPPYTAKQFVLQNGIYHNGNPYCPTFGPSANDFNKNDYADMMENTVCAGFGQPIG